MSTNSPASKLSYVIINNGNTDHPLEQGETWKFIVAVDDTFDAYNQMSKCQLQAAQFGHTVMNVYLDSLPFNPRGWYTDEENHDKIEYDDDIKIDNLTDEIARRKESEDELTKPDNPTNKKHFQEQGIIKSGSSDTYTKSYLQDLGRRWGIDAEAGHLIEKGYAVTIVGNGQYQFGASVDVFGMEREKEKLTRSIQNSLKKGRIVEQDVSIVKVWSGAIYMSAPMEKMESQPEFSFMDYALSCHFVEYEDNGKFWKFFWSKPKEYGPGNIFSTNRMKEDLSADEHRYFNDAKGTEQKAYNSTFSLLNSPAFDCGLSFLYRQHFSSSTQAFMGGLVDNNPYGVNEFWMQKFIE